MVGMTIQNQVNHNDSFRRKDPLSAHVRWSVFENVSQSNSRFNALDMLVVTGHSVNMPVGFGTSEIKSRDRPLSVMAHLKRSIVEVQAEKNCLAHALIIAITKVDKDPNYKAYTQAPKIRHVVRTLLERPVSICLTVRGSPKSYVSSNTFGRIRQLTTTV